VQRIISTLLIEGKCFTEGCLLRLLQSQWWRGQSIRGSIDPANRHVAAIASPSHTPSHVPNPAGSCLDNHRRNNPDTGLACGKTLFLLNDWPITGHTNTSAVASVLHTAPSASSHLISDMLRDVFRHIGHRSYVTPFFSELFPYPAPPWHDSAPPAWTSKCPRPLSSVAPNCNSVLSTDIAQPPVDTAHLFELH